MIARMQLVLLKLFQYLHRGSNEAVAGRKEKQKTRSHRFATSLRKCHLSTKKSFEETHSTCFALRIPAFIESDWTRVAESASTLSDEMETSTPSSSSSSSSSSSRVGLLTVHIYSALKFHPIDAADGELYILCSLDGEQEQRTHTVYQSASPIFHSSLSFSVPHFRSLLVMHLVDARTDKRIGRAAMSLYAVSVRQSQTMSEELLYDGKNNPMGVLNLKIAFKEDISALFLATHPRAIAPSPPEALSVERLRDHVNRITALVRLVGQMGVEYRRITQWEEPLLSTTVLLLFVYACLRLNSEYFLCVPLFLLLYLMVSAYLRRADGSFQKQYIEMDSGIASSEDSKASSSLASSSFHHRAIAVLRIAVCGFRNFSSSQTPGTAPTTAVILQYYSASIYS